MLNAKYAISIARRIGCCIFLLWEDIVEVNPKMILTFVGSMISVGTGSAAKERPRVNSVSEERRTLSRKPSNVRFERPPVN
jgi:hypothetical protein